MPKTLDLDYYYGNEAEQYSFYRVPKVLFTDPQYKIVSAEAKILYGLMLDRMSLSIKNGWADNGNRVFIFFTLEDALDLLGCGKDKAVKLFKELDTVDGIGLIERKKQGQGKPTKIYVKNFVTLATSQTSEKPKSALPGTAEVLTSEKPKSGLRKNRSLDCGKTAASNTDLSNTDLNDTELSIHPSAQSCQPKPEKQEPVMDKMDSIEIYTEFIRENIEFDILLERHPYDKERLDGLVDLMVEVVCGTSPTVRIGQEDTPRELVKSRFLKLNECHIEYVLDSLQKNTTQVRNVRAYLLTALYRAPTTMDQYYSSLVSHDMAQGFGAG